MGLPKEAQFTPDWSLNSGLTYREFLQAKEFETSVRYAIDEQTRKLIGSNEQLLKHGFRQLSEDVRGGFSILSRDIASLEQALRSGIAEIASAIRWGFTLLAIAIRQMNQTLEEIKRLLANPSWTWACEQFAKARDEYNRGLYPEALESITRAIHGHGSNTGWNSEFRFHFLLGRIQIGSWVGQHPNVSPDIIDPRLAEEAFLSAARYYRADDAAIDTGKVQALFFAGRAAFYQGDAKRAVEHTTAGLDTLSKTHQLLWASGAYQRAKYLCAQGTRLRDAKSDLLEAASLELGLLVDASADQDFLLRRKAVLDEVIADILRNLKATFDPLNKKCSKSFAAIRNFEFDGTAVISLLSEEVPPLEKEYANVLSVAATGGALDFDSAIKMIGLLIPKLAPLFGLFKKRFAEDRRRLWTASPSCQTAREADANAVLCTRELEKARAEYSYAEGRAEVRGWMKFVGGLYLFTLLTLPFAFLSPLKAGEAKAIALIAVMCGSLVILAWWPWIRYWVKSGPLRRQIRAAQKKLDAALRVARSKHEAADSAWRIIQKKIDELNRMSAPF